MYPGLKINLHKSYCTFMTVSQFFPIPLYYGLQMAKKKRKKTLKTLGLSNLLAHKTCYKCCYIQLFYVSTYKHSL